MPLQHVATVCTRDPYSNLCRDPAAILLGLLGVFVVWLCIVAVLITAIVAHDVGRRLLRRLAPSLIGTLQRPAVSVPALSTVRVPPI